MQATLLLMEGGGGLSDSSYPLEAPALEVTVLLSSPWNTRWGRGFFLYFMPLLGLSLQNALLCVTKILGYSNTDI